MEVPSSADILDLPSRPGFEVTWFARDDGACGRRLVQEVRRHLGLPPSTEFVALPELPSDLDIDVWETPRYSAAGRGRRGAAVGAVAGPRLGRHLRVDRRRVLAGQGPAAQPGHRARPRACPGRVHGLLARGRRDEVVGPPAVPRWPAVQRSNSEPPSPISASVRRLVRLARGGRLRLLVLGLGVPLSRHLTRGSPSDSVLGVLRGVGLVLGRRGGVVGESPPSAYFALMSRSDVSGASSLCPVDVRVRRGVAFGLFADVGRVVGSALPSVDCRVLASGLLCSGLGLRGRCGLLGFGDVEQ